MRSAANSEPGLGIKRELIPLDPSTATALAEAFIEADEVFFTRRRFG